MKEKYLRELYSELKKYNIPQDKIDVIISDCEKTYNLGLDAGIDEEDLIEKIGDPVKLASEYANAGNNFSFEGSKYSYLPTDDYQLKLEFINGTVDFIYHNNESLVVTDNKENEQYFTIEFDNNCLKISNKKKFKFAFKEKKKCEFKIYLPRGIRQKKVTIKDINSTIKGESFNANEIIVETVNGNISFNRLLADEVTISTVNGNYKACDIICKKLKANTVNGRMEIDNVEAKRIDLETVCGKIEIHHVDPDIVRSSKVLGKININQ